MKLTDIVIGCINVNPNIKELFSMGIWGSGSKVELTHIAGIRLLMPAILPNV